MHNILSLARMIWRKHLLQPSRDNKLRGNISCGDLAPEAGLVNEGSPGIEISCGHKYAAELIKLWKPPCRLDSHLFYAGRSGWLCPGRLRQLSRVSRNENKLRGSISCGRIYVVLILGSTPGTWNRVDSATSFHEWAVPAAARRCAFLVPCRRKGALAGFGNVAGL